MVEVVFYLALLGSLYSYLGYPLLLRAVVTLRPGKHSAFAGSSSQRWSFVIAARNESSRILGKISDTLSLVGDKDAEIIIISDASDDGTDQLVRSVGDRRVRLERQNERQGKESSQALGIRTARGDIIVFSDVATRIRPGSIEALVECFSDPLLGR